MEMGDVHYLIESFKITCNMRKKEFSQYLRSFNATEEDEDMHFTVMDDNFNKNYNMAARITSVIIISICVLTVLTELQEQVTSLNLLVVSVSCFMMMFSVCYEEEYQFNSNGSAMTRKMVSNVTCKCKRFILA